ncbi:Rv0909 family putative TA system antitoxin [Streptomyces sp. NPDC050095]|uniref:Rv0909 family putative TA system antitoxin n=1 Tax=unclassified Streptomyces TaxID=2593676 RepID=UPI00341EEAE7
MGAFDKFKDQAQEKAGQISDSLEEEINEKTGGKFADKVDKAQNTAEKAVGMNREQKPDEQQGA